MYGVCMNWTVADARARFAEVIRTSAEAPQRVFNRDRVVAVVVDPVEYAAFAAWRSAGARSTLGDALMEVRDICGEDGYELAAPERTPRRDPFEDP